MQILHLKPPGEVRKKCFPDHPRILTERPARDHPAKIMVFGFKAPPAIGDNQIMSRLRYQEACPDYSINTEKI